MHLCLNAHARGRGEQSVCVSPLAQLSANHRGVLVPPLIATDGPPDAGQIDLHPAIELGAASLQTHRAWDRKTVGEKVDVE